MPPAQRGAAQRLGETPVWAWWSDAAAGDQRAVASGRLPPPVPAGLALRRLRQVHGAAVLVVDAPAPAGTAPWLPAADGGPPEGDALVGLGPGSCLAVLTADCAPVALGSPEGVQAAVHVGWRGLVAGVVEAAVEAMRVLGATEIVGGLGPTIHPCCYAFSPADLDLVAAVAGAGVRGLTADGRPALDVPAAVRERLDAAQVQVVVDVERCTGCGGGGFSHRSRGDEGRQAVFVWQGTGIR